MGTKNDKKTELTTEQELQNYKVMFGQIDDAVKFYMDALGEICLVVRRDYKQFYGVLLKANFELKDIEILIDEETKNYDKKTIIKEKRIMKIPVGSMTDFEVLKHREEIPDIKE